MGNIKNGEVVNVEPEDVALAEFLKCDDRVLAALVEYIFATQEGKPAS